MLTGFIVGRTGSFSQALLLNAGITLVAAAYLVLVRDPIRLGMNTAIVEKDFWVCWILKLLFAEPGLKNQTVFKGGLRHSRRFLRDWRRWSKKSTRKDDCE